MIRPLRHLPRPGVAPLELMMALPMLLLLTVFLFRVGQVGLQRAILIVMARQQAWQQRQTDSGASESQLPTVPRAFGLVRNDNKAPQGLYRAVPSRTVPIAPIANLNLTIQARHVVLGDVNDHRSTEFRRHSRLLPDRRVERLAMVRFDLSRLSNFEQFFKSSLSSGRQELEKQVREELALQDLRLSPETAFLSKLIRQASSNFILEVLSQAASQKTIPEALRNKLGWAKDIFSGIKRAMKAVSGGGILAKAGKAALKRLLGEDFDIDLDKVEEALDVIDRIEELLSLLTDEAPR